MTSVELLELLFEVMNNRNLDRLDDVLSEEVVFHFPKTQPLVGKRRVVTFLKVLFRKYPELLFTLGRTTGNDNVGAVEWTNKGTSKSGELYENAGVTFIETDGEKIVYMSDTFKDTGAF